MKNTNGKLKKDNYKHTDWFPQEVYEKITPELSALTQNSEWQRRQRDIILASLIAILSGCFPKVYGKYFGKKVYPYLYQIIGGPAGSGKGGMELAMMIGDKIQSELSNRQKVNIPNLKDMILGTGVEMASEPQEPEIQQFYIPGNNSAAGMILLLSKYGGRAVIAETEVDTLVLILGQKFGDYSDILRKAFHHERVSSFRKTKEVHKTVLTPCLSLLLSGTPEQLVKLIKSSENGLFSRIIFYVYDDKPKWADPFSTEHADTVKLFEQFADRIAQNYMGSFDESEKEFQFTEDQKIKFNAKFPEIVEDYYHAVGNEGVSVPMRMGLMFFRIAMILGAVRNIGQSGNIITCCDSDFEATNLIINVLLGHSLAVFSSLPSIEDTTDEFMSDEELLGKLPMEFESKAVTAVMTTKFGYSQRSAFRHLGRLKDRGLIHKLKLGRYRKGKRGDKE